MDSTSVTLTVLFSVIGAWMLWRINRMPAPSATHPPAISSRRPYAADGIAVADDLDLRCQVSAEYAGRADLVQVVVVNDDTTPMKLVIFVLQNVFQFPYDLAFHATIVAHTDGECVIAVLPDTVAAERIAAARAVAETVGGDPLQIITRPLPDEADQPAAA
jgi:ATP-dependent Clp protease adapter protein ClpS